MTTKRLTLTANEAGLLVSTLVGAQIRTRELEKKAKSSFFKKEFGDRAVRLSKLRKKISKVM